MSTEPNQADVDALRGLLDLMANFESNDQRARYLLSSDWMRDRDAAPVASRERVAEVLSSATRDMEYRRWETPQGVQPYVGALLAAGIFRDEATVKAEALEEALASGEFPGLTVARDWIANRAAALRAGEPS